ncbi:MAG: hypothetical protein II777_04770 [Clostridia bacterium]|nr:hypothetical protein [Clostridia bacterium]
MAVIHFLGTGAADYSPLLGTDFKDGFDKNARRSTAVLLDNKYLFDCGEHALDSIRIANVNKEEIKFIFISHLHGDHYNPDRIAKIAANQSEPVKLYVREDAELPYIPNVKIMRMKNFVRYAVDQDMAVTGLPANHDERVKPRHFLIEYKGKKMFYGLDGGWMLNGTYNYLRNSGLDLMILDATCGDYEGDFRMAEHNSIPMIRLMLPSLKTVGIVGDHTRIVLSHIAPSLNKPHDETAKIAGKFGAEVAYDGFITEF